MRGVIDAATPRSGSRRRCGDALVGAMPDLLAAFDEMRAAEGAALEAVLGDQIDQIAGPDRRGG